MERRVFLDTNIVLDLLVEERSDHHKAKNLVIFLLEKSIEIVISEDMLSTIYYVTKDKEKTLLFLKTIQSQWYITHYGSEVIMKSLHYALNKKCDLEDALQCFTAIENGCKTLITSDRSFVQCGDIILANYDNYESLLNAS